VDEKIELNILEYYQTPLNTVYLVSTQYQKLIKKISSVIGNVTTVKDIIDLDPVYFSNLPGIGKKHVEQLIELQSKLPEFLESQSKKTALFNDNYSIDFNEIDNILLEDIENYLWTLDEKRMDIALSRWGFNQQHESLEEVGNRHKITRERVRQLEKPITANLPLSFRIQPKILWANIREKMTEDLTILLPNLSKCFETDKLFYGFIELCCQVESGSIHKIVFTKIDSTIINQLFCTNPSPISQYIVINELVSNYGYSKASAINGIKNLISQEKIEMTEQGIYPKNLTRYEAIAHVLMFDPAGLPWKDIAGIVNKKGYSSKKMDEERLNHGFSDSEHVYQCGKGTYRNLIFLDIEQFDIPNLMQQLLDYFKRNNLSALHLHDYYQSTRKQQANIEYFPLRHIVREYGEEYGIYFNGKSNTDSVSLNSDVKLICQADIVVKLLNESKVMTAQEIAERLRSKSTNHAKFYLTNLMEEGRVVRVDKMLYTTPEKAFSGFDTKAVMQIIQDIMNTSHKIVEADVFREYVNIELNLSYSKFIYSALVRTQLKELGWYRNSTLFSKSPIPYKNILDMCKQLCHSEFSNSENSAILKKAVWLTDGVIAAAIQQWKWQISH